MAATVFADFVHRKQAVIPRGGIVGECVGGCVPTLAGGGTVPPHGLRHALGGGFAAAGFAENVNDAAIDVKPLQERGGKGGA